MDWASIIFIFASTSGFRELLFEWYSHFSLAYLGLFTSWLEAP